MIQFDGVEYVSSDQITTYSNDKLLMEFKNIIEPLYKKDNLDKHLKYVPEVGEKMHMLNIKYHTEYKPNDNWYCLRLTRYSIDGSIFFSKNYTNILQYKDYKQFQNTKNSLKFYIPFIDKKDVIHIKNYLKTFFARMCLYLISTSNELMRGELKYIPYFNFSNSIFSKSPSEIDNYLFKTFKISNEIRKHIEEILPDYYGIRKVKINNK